MSPPDSAADTVAATRAISPRFAAGLARIHRVIETDGALPAVEKALFVAAAAATKGRRDVLRAALTRAAALGLPPAAAGGTAISLLLARGEGVFADFTAIATELLGPFGGREAAASEPGEPDQLAEGEGVAYFREHFGGELPLRQRVFAEVLPLAFDGYHLMHRAALKENALAPKTVELMMCAANAADYQGVFLGIHVEGARALGATDAELAEAVVCAIPAAGIAVWPNAAEAILRTRKA